MLRDIKKYSTALAETQVSESLSHFFFSDQSSAYTERWRRALEDNRCVSILLALFTRSARSPSFALTASQIGRLTGLHHQVVRRLVRGDKRCKARLQGLVAWLVGKGRRGTRYWLSPEGAKVAELLAKGLQLGEATLRALATDRFRRKTAHLAEIAHKNCTPSENNMPPYGVFYVCGDAVASKLGNKKPVGQQDRPINPLAERLWRDFHMVARIANDVVQRYPADAIEAAIALCQKRNGRVWNSAGFIIHLLREGFAQAYAETYRRKAQSDEPDFSVEALRTALAPYGICVDEEGYAVFAHGRLALPPDPSEALARLREWGLLPSRPEALNEPDVEREKSVSVSDQPDQDSKAELTCRPGLAAESEWTEENANSDLINEPTDHSDKELAEPLPANGDEDKNDATACPRCGSSGELQLFEPQPFALPFVAADPELARWSGKALCEPCRCYLRVREGKVLFSNAAKRTKLPDPAGGNLPTVADFVDTETWLAWAFADSPS